MIDNVCPKRMGKFKFLFIVCTTLLSISVLIFQTIEYNQNSCGCGEDIPEIVLTFREYGTLYGIPISLLGIIGMLLLLLNVIGISYLSADYELRIWKRTILISEKISHRWIALLKIQVVIMTIIAINLILIEVFIIEYICFNCSISQAVIIMNTVIILNWNPFLAENPEIKKGK